MAGGTSWQNVHNESPRLIHFEDTDSDMSTKALVFPLRLQNGLKAMARPSTHGGKAARAALNFVDHWLSEVVDLMSDELNFHQRYCLRIQILRYILEGDRQRAKDTKVQRCFEFILTTYINLEETL